jgi:hypothetical protein
MEGHLIHYIPYQPCLAPNTVTEACMPRRHGLVQTTAKIFSRNADARLLFSMTANVCHTAPDLPLELLGTVTSGTCNVVQLQESWSRDIQVLPSRTHPMMVMHGSGGYLLSGLRVLGCPPPEGQRSGPKQKRRRH